MAVSSHGFKRPWRTRLVLSAVVLCMVLILYRLNTNPIQLLIPAILQEFTNASQLVDAPSVAGVRVVPHTIKPPPIQTYTPKPILPQASAHNHVEQEQARLLALPQGQQVTGTEAESETKDVTAPPVGGQDVTAVLTALDTDDTEGEEAGTARSGGDVDVDKFGLADEEDLPGQLAADIEGKVDELEDAQFEPQPQAAQVPGTVADGGQATTINSKVAEFILFRVIGNDLPPRHKVGQAYTNLRFILENEPELPGCEKRWVVSHIFNETEEARIMALLREHGQKYIHLPLDYDEYARLSTRFEGFAAPDILRSETFTTMPTQMRSLLQDEMEHEKIRYVLNLNTARNVMIDAGVEAGATWILPFDGNSFFTRVGWDAVRSEMGRHAAKSIYFTVPMARITSNSNLLNPSFWPEANEEPQIMMHRTAAARYDETLRYGCRPKVELLMRLGVKGPWDSWPGQYAWERNATDKRTVIDEVKKHPVRSAGWVARLYSGQAETELQGPEEVRGVTRARGIQLLLARVSAKLAVMRHNFTSSTLLSFNESVLEVERDSFQKTSHSALAGTVARLIKCADYALTQGPYSVVHKTELPPSKNVHDYYTPKPYFWPNPYTKSGVPYIRMDGQRVPGTILYDEQSHKFDRTRLAAMVGNTTCLALAYYFTYNETYAVKAADNIRTWFLDPDTAMVPSSKYAQIHWGVNKNLGESTGVIEFKDFYFFLDAVRLVARSPAFPANYLAGLQSWFRRYRGWLEKSRQGKGEYLSRNNHGLYFEVQLAAINAFVGDIPRFMHQVNLARGRILSHFSEDGSLPHEMVRKTQLHYLMFTLQGWYTLARMASMAGVDYWHFRRETDRMPPLKRCAIFTVPYLNNQWKHYQESQVDMGRTLPLFYTAIAHYPDLRDRSPAPAYGSPQAMYSAKPLFHEHDGIQPFWNLGLALLPN